MQELSLIQKIITWAVPVLFAITVHEVAHGWVALRFGDSTAKMAGRLSLNPFKHVDPVGTVIVPGLLLAMGGFLFGWAKPVPVNFANLDHPKRDMVYVALAGPGVYRPLHARLCRFASAIHVGSRTLYQHHTDTG